MRSPSRSSARAVAASVLVVGSLAVGVSPAVGATTAATSSCEVTSADLSWGFKESFRSYISGRIANGEWAVADGAAYETPNFSWTGGTGTYDPATGTGEITFAGGIHFTGHDGLLDTTIANPTVVVEGGVAELRLDITGVTMEDAMSGADVEPTTDAQVPFVEITLPEGALTEDGLSLTDAATAITAEGFEAFPNYETGTAFDPLTLEVAGECVPEPTPTSEPTPEPTSTEVAAAADAAPAASEGANVPVIAGVAAGVIVVGAVGGVLVARSRRRARNGAADDAS